jgi:glycosyltransferase involved in cell wall biosynthesis
MFFAPVGDRRVSSTSSHDADVVFTVATPTFNRAHTLPRVYESLELQTFRSFEWIVIDDGSTDDTRDLVEHWTASASFPIRYFHQENSGKAAGENRAAELARGSLLAILDSDDWYATTALEDFADAWDSIPRTERGGFVGIVALCVDESGALIGDRFPSDVLDTDYIELRSRYGVRGDKSGCARLDVVRAFPYPIFEGERRGTFEGIVLRRIARQYRCRCVNRIVLHKEYQPGGVSASGGTLWVASPRSAKLSMLESLLDSDLGLRSRLLTYAHHFRFALHARLIRQSWHDSPSKLWWAASAPLGSAAYLRDRRRERASP